MTNELARYALTFPSSGQLTKRYIWVDRRDELIVLLQVTVTHTPSPFEAESMDKSSSVIRAKRVRSLCGC